MSTPQWSGPVEYCKECGQQKHTDMPCMSNKCCRQRQKALVDTPCDCCLRPPLSVCRNVALQNNWDLMKKITEPLRAEPDNFPPAKRTYKMTVKGKSSSDTPLSYFETELQRLINKFSLENDSDTPDFILAQYLTECLITFNSMVLRREEWYGRTKKES